MNDLHRFHPSYIEDPTDPDYATDRATLWAEDRSIKYGALVVLFWGAVIGLIAYALSGCALPHVAPALRSVDISARTVATVDVECGDSPDLGDPVTDAFASSRHGTGVVISERHVLTAAHVVGCPYIPVAYVTLSDGRRFRMNVERDDIMFGDGRDLARLEIATAERFELDIPPPTLARTSLGPAMEYLCAYTSHGRVCGDGWVGEHAVALEATTRTGDSGAGIYTVAGALAGVVGEGSRTHTRGARIDAKSTGDL